MNVENSIAEHELSGGVIHPWHMDQFGHMNVRWYGHFFDDASFLFWDKLGLDQSKMIRDFGVHSVTVQSTTQFKAELTTGACVRVYGRVDRVGGKSVTLQMRLAGASGGDTFAVCETVEVFVDAKTHESTLIPDTVRQKLQE